MRRWIVSSRYRLERPRAQGVLMLAVAAIRSMRAAALRVASEYTKSCAIQVDRVAPQRQDGLP